MADEKPLPATASRLRKARRGGDLPHAPELLALTSFAGGLTALQTQMPQILNAAAVFLTRLIRVVMESVREHNDPLRGLGSVAAGPLAMMIFAFLMTIGSCACSAILIARVIGTVGWNVPTIKFGRLAPAKNLQRIVSRETLTAVIRSLGISLLLLTVILLSLYHVVEHILGLYEIRRFMVVAAQNLTHMLWLILGIGGIFSVIEARAGIARWHKKLRMSFEEIKREYREQNGDPHMRGQRKRRQRRMARGGKAAIIKATVVVTNPTHIAIALVYNPPAIGVPVIVARAADEGAAYVRRIAREAGVPIVEAVTLARLLYAQADEGDPIPVEAYAMVAPIIAGVLAQGDTRA